MRLRQQTILGFSALVLSCALASAASLGTDYTSQYASSDLGTIAGLPTGYGGMTFLPNDPNTLLIGTNSLSTNAGIYSVSVLRDAQNHITGFSNPVFTAYACSTTGGIDGGLAFGPNGILFYTSFPDNRIGEIQPGSTTSGHNVSLTTPGVGSSVGALSFLPTWLSSSTTTFKLASYSDSIWYTGTLTPTAGGYYNVTISPTTVNLPAATGPEGFTYVQAGSTPLFTTNSVLITEYNTGDVSSYQIDANGDPILSTRQTFLTGLQTAEGALIDPLTGDFLFSDSSDSDLTLVRQFTSLPSNDPPAVPLPSSAYAGLALLSTLAAFRLSRRHA
ncbi:MAG TPA: hypothetical protein VFE58_10845 [Tepidisphaeraceae bacterium]|nr:hypothetical protein [Tepidisphaeraceae bacterium]